MNPTVRDVLDRLDTDFSAVAAAVGNGEFALWVGSGISGRSPNLGGLIERALEFLRSAAVDPATMATYRPAFDEAIDLAETDQADVAPHLNTLLCNWPEQLRNAVVDRLWKKYSALLDIRIQGKDEDFILWEAIDIRDAFAAPAPPAAEHLCIAILVLEGAISDIASANWDGFIEAAVEQLGPGREGNIQVVVDPDQLRDGAAKARLLKFHGCIIHATDQPNLYRKFLTGSTTQINGWAGKPLFKPMVDRVTAVATDKKAMLVGLSLQDVNLQILFGNAREAHPWPWPCAPSAQGHVFCNQKGLGPEHLTMLKSVYLNNYNTDIAGIKASALLQAWPEQVLLALVLRIVTDKLNTFLLKHLEGSLLAPDVQSLSLALRNLRNAAAEHATGDRTAFTYSAIASWTKLLAIFRSGGLPLHPASYSAINDNVVALAANDQNAVAAGFGTLATMLSLLQSGADNKRWTIGSAGAQLAEGALTGLGEYPGAQATPIFLVRGAAEAIELQKAGSFSDGAIVIHGDDLWTMMQPAGPAAAPTSGRTRKRAPGRTGKITRHVCLKRLIENSDTMADLHDRFAKAMAL
ncbi:MULTISPECIES: hypothetical protein [unclassified Sphingopyxis]|uniref:hypothetical protein n=1 Tax=unclassified Sphingopyxis TaxID=2614943 RepID=UPI0012E3F576|nr:MULTISPECIES: hypothetical protein [unclassified Sphingopyxis]